MTREGNFVKALFPALALLLLAAAGAASPAKACQAGPFTFGELLAAEVIVRATAVKYVVAPADPNLLTTGVPDSTVEFRVGETLKGSGVSESLVLNGYLSDKDDFNENRAPYRFVRAGGRAGSCYANTYKQGAQFLLFLKKTATGYTPNVIPLGPTNEQLKSETDPWLLWVKVRLNPCGKLYEHDENYELVNGIKRSEVSKKPLPKDIAYRFGKCYLQKYEVPDGTSDQYIKYIKKWVERFEREEEQR